MKLREEESYVKVVFFFCIICVNIMERKDITAEICCAASHFISPISQHRSLSLVSHEQKEIEENRRIGRSFNKIATHRTPCRVRYVRNSNDWYLIPALIRQRASGDEDKGVHNKRRIHNLRCNVDVIYHSWCLNEESEDTPIYDLTIKLHYLNVIPSWE